MHYETLIKLAEILAAHLGRSEATISNRVTSHARLFSRLRAGKGCSLKTASHTLYWFSENWPEELSWPGDIPRPQSPKKGAA